jgi:hypothetical protein
VRRSSDARAQLGRAERLRDVVVGAGLQRRDQRVFTRTSGDQDDGDMAKLVVALGDLDQGQAVQPGHHHVGQHHVEAFAAHHTECLLAVVDGADPVAATQQLRDVRAHVAVILHEQHARQLFAGGLDVVVGRQGVPAPQR